MAADCESANLLISGLKMSTLIAPMGRRGTPRDVADVCALLTDRTAVYRTFYRKCRVGRFSRRNEGRPTSWLPRIGCLRAWRTLVYQCRRPLECRTTTVGRAWVPGKNLPQSEVSLTGVSCSCSVSRAWWNGRHARLRIPPIATPQGFTPFR